MPILSCPGLCLHGCPHPKLALGGVPRMLSTTAGWGGRRAGHISGTWRIPSMGTSEVTRYQRRCEQSLEAQPPSHIRPGMFCMSSGEERTVSLQQPLGISIVFSPLHPACMRGHLSRALADEQEQTAETLCAGDTLTFQGQAKRCGHFTLEACTPRSWEGGGYLEYPRGARASSSSLCRSGQVSSPLCASGFSTVK